MPAHQAPLSLGFSRQEHWSGLPFPSPMHESEKWKGSRSVMSDSSRPHGLQPTRLLHPWDFPGKSTGVGCHCLLPSQFLTDATEATVQRLQNKIVRACEALSLNLFGQKRTSSVTLYPQRRMWKVLFESFKQKIYHLPEVDLCQKLGCLDIWFQISFIKFDRKCIVGAVSKVMMRENELHTRNRKALGHPPS